MKAKIFKMLVVMAGLIAIAIMNGVVLCAMWNWFIVSIFQCKPILFLQATGLSFIINYFSFSTREFTAKSTEDYDWKAGITAAFTKSAMALGFASLLHYLL